MDDGYNYDAEHVVQGTAPTSAEVAFDRADMPASLVHGTFGQVRFVQGDPSNDMQAIKRISKVKFRNFKEQYGSSLELLDECKWLQRVHHPLFVGCASYSESEHYLFLSMQAAVGLDLLSTIEAGLLSEERVKELTRRLGNGLLYLHNRNVAHRDIKPENIVISEEKHHPMQCKLIDFGFVRECLKDSGCRTQCGTRSYMAPEI